MKEDGSATWFSPEASQDAAAAYGKDAAKVETRKVARAEEGHVLKLGDEVLGTQIWLKDGSITECLTEVKEEVDTTVEEDVDPLGDMWTSDVSIA